MFLERSEISRQLDITDPFLMIDDINIDLKTEKAISSKFLNKNEWFFSSHLTKDPVMPATLQIEGMLQTLVLLIYNISDDVISRSYIVDIKTKFHKKVFNQPLINYHAELLLNSRGIFKGIVIGMYSSEKICEGEFTYASPDFMLYPKIKKLD